MIAYNQAVSQGAGVFVDDGASAVMHNDLIHHNTTASGMAGGILVDDGIVNDIPVSSSLQLVNCTVVFNNLDVPPADPFGTPGANGIFLDGRNVISSATVTNCIFWGNGDDFYGQADHFSLTVTHSLSAESVTGIGNFNARDPLFADQASGNLSLLAGSPCIDAGNNLPWVENVGAIDFNNRPRIVNGTVDLGALEFVGTATPYSIWAGSFGLSGAAALPATDPDQDGSDNLAEFAFGTNPTVIDTAPITTTFSGGQLVVTFLHRIDGTLAYTVQGTDNLATLPFADNSAVTASLTNGPVSPTPPTGYVRKQFSVPTTTGYKFCRIQADD